MLDKLDADIKAAMLDGDMVRVSVLKMLKSAMQNQAIENKGKLTDEDAVEVLMREHKKRKEAADMYEKGGDEVRAATELAEAEIIAQYLPKQLDEDELRTIIKQTIEEAKTDNMGQIMGLVMSKVRGKADGNTVSQLVREELAK